MRFTKYFFPQSHQDGTLGPYFTDDDLPLKKTHQDHAVTLSPQTLSPISTFFA